MIRWLYRLTSTLFILALLVMPPAAIAAWTAARRPSVATLRAWLADPPPQAIAWAVALSAGLALWLLLAAVAVRHTARRTATIWRRLRRLPLPTPTQATAGSLAGTALLGLPPMFAHADTHPIAAASSDTDHPDRRTHRDEHSHPPSTHHAPGGLELSDGGWMTDRQAADIAAMVSLFWLRRRQAYQPGHHKPPPALPPVTDAAAAHAAHHGMAGQTGPLAPEEIPTGTTLTGPGATAAARGLLVTTLMTNTTIGDPRAHVVITDDDLTSLFEGHPPSTSVPGLHVPATADGIHDHRHDWTRTDATAPRILHLSAHPVTAPHSDACAVVTFDASGTARGDHAWHVAASGRTVTLTTAIGSPRLCVLPTATAVDLLALIQHAHGSATEAAPASAADAEPRIRISTPRTTVGRPARLSVLGDLRLTIHQEPVSLPRTAAWQILVLLAAHTDGLTARDIVATIWPGPPPAGITNRLYTTLSSLHNAVRHRLDDRTLVVRREDRYTLDRDLVDVDLWRLQAAACAAVTALTTTDRRIAHREVIDTFAELAAGHRWTWLQPHRDSVRQHATTAYTHLARDLAPDQAFPLLREAIAMDPYNEHLHERAAAALIALGDHAAAEHLREEYRTRLVTHGLQQNA